MATRRQAPAGWSVYHRSEAGSPELHTGGEWFFQPDDFDGGEVWSRGYPSQAAALAACEAEAAEIENENQAIAERGGLF